MDVLGEAAGDPGDVVGRPGTERARAERKPVCAAVDGTEDEGEIVLVRDDARQSPSAGRGGSSG